ncbi:hypothetical protein [Nostoc sp. NZL]|nr:hypothetical protein [Nostoc sp. NZL]
MPLRLFGQIGVLDSLVARSPPIATKEWMQKLTSQFGRSQYP